MSQWNTPVQLIYANKMIFKKYFTPKKLLELLIKEYSKVAGYTVNIPISLAFLYTNNEQSEKQIKRTFTCTIAPDK
jgi:hypothetical protein